LRSYAWGTNWNWFRSWRNRPSSPNQKKIEKTTLWEQLRSIVINSKGTTNTSLHLITTNIHWFKHSNLSIRAMRSMGSWSVSLRLDLTTTKCRSEWRWSKVVNPEFGMSKWRIRIKGQEFGSHSGKNSLYSTETYTGVVMFGWGTWEMWPAAMRSNS
jgi:hypothetical protein